MFYFVIFVCLYQKSYKWFWIGFFMVIKLGNKVKVEYEGRFSDGEVFDSTAKHGGEPIEFVVGSGMLVSGFEKAVEGMNEGEEKEVTLKPEDAYGEINPQYVQALPKEKFPAEAQVGMMIGIPTPMGQIPAKITAIDEKTVTVDMNHPLAGKTLVFKIKVVSFEDGDFLAELKKAQEEQMKKLQEAQTCSCSDEDTCNEEGCSCEEKAE